MVLKRGHAGFSTLGLLRHTGLRNKSTSAISARTTRLNIRFLDTFVWVARLRSFRLAAVHLHATQSAISQRIAALESDLGVKLLDRHHHEVTLTPEGALVLERAETIVLTYSEIKRGIFGKKALKPIVRIGVSDVVSLSFLPHLYTRLIREYEVQRIEARVDIPPRNHQALKDGEIDIAIGPSIWQGDEMVNVGLCDFSMHWVASSQLEFPEDPIALSSFTKYPIILPDRPSLPHRLLGEQLLSADRGALRLLSVSSLASLIQLVLGGVGVSALPAAVVQREIAQGLLQIVPFKEPIPDVRIAMTYLHVPEDATPHLLLASLKDAISEYCDQQGDQFVTNRL